jgi:hypothetical protein
VFFVENETATSQRTQRDVIAMTISPEKEGMKSAAWMESSLY